MADLYTGEEVTGVRRTLHREILACVLSLAVALVVCVILCFFVTDTNAKLLRNVNITLSSVGGCAALFLLLNIVLPRAARLSVLRQLTGGQPQTLCGTVTGIGGELTLRRGLTVRELTLCAGNAERTLFWDTEKPCPLTVGTTVTVRTVENTVVGYEVAS